MAKPRENFSASTINIIAQRAAYRCSFPGCGRLLVGPGAAPDDVVNLGQCAHIFSAAVNGPRGRAELSPSALTSSDNGIFLCQQHHKLIDSKAGIKKYPASVLLYFKAQHEHHISQEIGSLQYPMLWITSIRIIKAPFLGTGEIFNFARANILCGGNGTGKSLIIELLYCALTGTCIKRFENIDIEFEIKLSNQVYSTVVCSITNNRVFYKIEDKQLPFCPLNIEVIYIHEYKNENNTLGDDIDYFCRSTNLNKDQVIAIIESTDMSDGCMANELQLKTVRHKPYGKVDLYLKRCDSAYTSNNCLWQFCQLSQTEQSRIMFDLLINHVKTESKYRPVVLLIDTPEFYVYDAQTQKHYLKALQENSNYFQTVMAHIPSRENIRNLALSFPGWSTISLIKHK